LSNDEKPRFNNKPRFYGGRFVYFKNFNKNYLAVIAKREGEGLYVITCHWVARLKKK